MARRYAQSEQTQEKRIAKKIRAAMEELLDLARSRGCKNPEIYIECGEGLYVMDGDHPAQRDAGSHSAGERQQAVVISINGAFPPKTGVGAW